MIIEVLHRKRGIGYGKYDYYRPTKAIVNLEAIKENVKALKSYLGQGTSIIAVVKADGYGHGDVEAAHAALEAGAAMVSVATPDEAVRLRKFGISWGYSRHGPIPCCICRRQLQS